MLTIDHGSDYEGNHCRKLIRLASEAMDAVQGLLLSVPRNKRANGCTDEEIRAFCGAYERLFQYFDKLSHYCYQPYGSITDSEMDSIRTKLVPAMDRLWRKLNKNVPPKVHAWQHLVHYLEALRGMKYHQESKIEVAHRIGKETELQFRSLAGSIKKKIKCALKYQANLMDEATKARQEEVKVSRARNLGEKSKATKAAKAEAAKKQKQADVNAVLNLPEIDGDFPSVLELTVRDRQNMAQAMNNVL